MGFTSVNPWSVTLAAACGGVLGILAATAYHLLHDHSRLASTDVLPHFLPQLIAGCVAGALVFGWAVAAHDRKARRKGGNRRTGSHYDL